jgi:DNA-directed RNA polymerase subunit K/omega
MLLPVKKITKFERARIIGARALQISMGAPVLIKVKKTDMDSIKIARAEFEKGVIPLTIKRRMPTEVEEEK